MNPELQRNLWLDATPRRLAFAAVAVVGVFVAVWLLDQGRHAYAITLAGALVFGLLALAWAPRAARASVTKEVRGGSWHFQRLSALTPWEMTWGKLAGSTARLWAMAGACLLMAALQLASTSSLRHAAFWMIVAVGLAVTLQAAGLATGLIDIRRARASGRPLSARAPGLLLVTATLLTLLVLFWGRQRIGASAGWLRLGEHPAAPGLAIRWFGRAIRPLPFAAASLVGLAAWALVWAWRLMRLELQFSSIPAAWTAFLAFAGLYAFGFDPAALPDAFARRLTAAAWVWGGLAYLAAFADPADKVRARQFWAALSARRPERVLSHLPLVALPSALALGACVVLAIGWARKGDAAAALSVCAVVGFFVRDLGVIVWRRFAGRGDQGDAGVLLALLVLYLGGGALGRLFGGGRGAALFWPEAAHPHLSLVSACVQAALTWSLAAVSIRRPTPPARRWTPAPVQAPQRPLGSASPGAAQHRGPST